MSDLDAVNRAVQSCVENADEHLASARELRKTGHNNMAYSAAVLALEEIGKAILIGMSRGYMADKEPGYVQDDWFEDHAKKLFWALWATSFSNPSETIKDFQELRHSANNIHERRLSALYVNPDKPDLPERIPNEEADAAIALAAHRVQRERNTFFGELNGEESSNLNWFMESCEDPELAVVIFGKDSFARLTSYNGDVRQWVLWLRSEITRFEASNQQFAEEELSRILPSGDEALDPKWSLKIRLRSWSHSVRGKALRGWNDRCPLVKLSTTQDRRELMVEFLVPKKIEFKNLGTIGIAISNWFAIALSVGTRGFFWWYVPASTGNFFQEIRDLERNVSLEMDSPSLGLSWGHRALTETELEETLLVYMYFSRLPQKRGEAYTKYHQGLALIAKNDIHGRFEPTIITMFFQAFRGCAIQHGHWDGSSPFIDAARKALEMFRDGIDSIDRELPRYIAIGETLLQGAPVDGLTVRDAIMMKLFCDLYILRLVHESVGDTPTKPKEAPA
jgi:AbiV family abortive infection protein